jgi:hypothetical protein
MKRYFWSSVFLLIAISEASAQYYEFKKVFGGPELEECYNIIETKNDKGFFVAGSTESFGIGEKDFLLIKADSLGQIDWAKAYGSKRKDHGRQVVGLMDGNYAMVGYTEGFHDQFKEILIIKLDKNGKKIWSKSYGLDRNDFATYVQATSDGGMVVLGETINNIGHEKNQDILIFKIDKNGNVQWSRIYGGNNTEYGYGIQETADKGYIISGETNSFGSGDWDFYAIKVNVDGDIEWSKAYGGKNTDYGRFAVQLKDGSYIMGGNSLSFGTTGLDLILIKLDPKGNILWSKSYGGEGTDYMLEIKNIPSGILVGGYTNSFGVKGEDGFVMAVKDDGKINWCKAYGGKKNDYAVSMTTTEDPPQLLIAGTTNTVGAGLDDIYVVRTTLTWSKNTCFSSDIKFSSLSVTPKVTDSKSYFYDLHVIQENVDIEETEVKVSEKDLCNMPVPVQY